MATFHSGSEGQTQKLQALRRRQKYLAFRAVIVPPVCWGICAASAPWWFPPLKETLGVRFDAQTQGWILLVLMLLMISLPVLLTVMAVGLVVSIFQAVTQINENTLSFVPKLVAAVLVFLVAGPWMLSTVVDFIRRTIENIPLALG